FDIVVIEPVRLSVESASRLAAMWALSERTDDSLAKEGATPGDHVSPPRIDLKPPLARPNLPPATAAAAASASGVQLPSLDILENLRLDGGDRGLPIPFALRVFLASATFQVLQQTGTD